MALFRNRKLNLKRIDQFGLLFRKLSVNSRLLSSRNETESTSTVTLSNGRELKFSCGKFARMADGASVVQSGNTAVMVTAVGEHSKQINSFLPLTVEFRMKYAAAGRIPTNFLRRELGPSEREILTARLIDRSVRPLFPTDYLSQVQIMCNLLSVDGIHDPEVLCINAASMALSVSDIPWNGPIGAVRVGLIGQDVIINPTRQELQESSMNLVVAGRASSKVVMLEGSFNNVNMNDLMHAVSYGLSECQTIIKTIEQVSRRIGKEKRTIEPTSYNQELIELAQDYYKEDVKEILLNFSHDKQSRDQAIFNLTENVTQKISDLPNNGYTSQEISSALRYITKKVFRDLIFETDQRCDGRGLADIRPISCEVDLYKPLHGSAIFQRGQTQVLCTVALDSPQSAIKTDSYTTLTSGIKEKNFFLHYEFPSYATNTISSSRGMNRREIGHGSLAEKGLRPVVPKDFPFCIRLTSEVLESNGSSSMASVCGGSLALLDAGVPISEVVAGVAMGLFTRLNDSNDIEDYRILTDILGMEDYMGDMDFKVAGSKRGFTALQVDFKIPGVPLSVIQEALAKGHAAKSKIINIMKETIREPKKKEEGMPILETFEVPTHKRSKLLGPGHINLKKVFIQTGVQLTPLEDATFSAFAPNDEAMQEAHDIVRRLMETENEPTLEFGAIYSVKILELKEIGVMVSLHPKLMPIFIHNSQLDVRKVVHPSALGLEVGQKLSVKYFGRDPANGQMRLSRKALQASSGVVHNFDKKTDSLDPKEVTESDKTESDKTESPVNVKNQS